MWKTPNEIRMLPWYAMRGCAFARFESGHAPLDLAGLGSSTRVVVVLREPTARLVSGLQHNFHDCFSLQEDLGVREYDHERRVACRDGGLTYTSCPKHVPCAPTAPLPDDAVARYARCVRGCQVNLLAGAWCGTRPFTKPRCLRRGRASKPGPQTLSPQASAAPRPHRCRDGARSKRAC